MIVDRRSVIWDIVDRLAAASVPEYLRSTFLGFHHGEDEYPILFPDGLWESGTWVLGGARSGKTQRVIALLGLQRILRNLGLVVFLDLKGDDALFHGMRGVAELAGREFLHFTNVPTRSTRLFNPLNQPLLQQTSRTGVAEMLATALNLYHGPGYGKQFFGMQGITGAAEALYCCDVQSRWGPTWGKSWASSFVQLEKRLARVVQDRPELRGAEALTMSAVSEILCQRGRSDST